VITLFLAFAAPDVSPLPGNDVATVARSLLAVLVVLGLIALCAWLVRRGALGSLGRKGPSALRIETALPLGDRRSLVLVSVEGRRLLLGLTPQQVTLVTELSTGETPAPPRAPAFSDALAKAGVPVPGPVAAPATPGSEERA
jgi:flagellar protein FliO/FliZ